MSVKPVVEAWTVIIPGSWNPMIFTPNWVGQNLFETDEVAVEFPIGNPSAPTRFKKNHIALTVLPHRLVLNTASADDVSLREMEQTARKTLEMLSHTPISAIGVNFMFVDINPNAGETSMFSHQDDGSVSDQGLELKVVNLVRKFQRGESELNLRLSFDSDKGSLTYDFNFHRQTRSTSEAMAFLNNSVVELRDFALKILQNVYHQDVDDLQETEAKVPSSEDGSEG